MPVYTEKQNLSDRHNANKHACKANKQTNKQTNRERIMRQTMHACKENKQRRNYETNNFFCAGPAPCSEKNLMKSSALSVKSLETLKSLPKMFFNMGFMNLC